MTKLALNTLGSLPSSVAVPTYDRAKLSPGIVHFGVGNFHRAHQACYLDALFNSGRETEGQLAYKAALTMMKNESNFSLDDKLDVLAAKLQFEGEAEAMQYGQALLKEISNNRRLQSNYYRILDFHLSKRPAERLELLRKRGNELLERGEFEEAFELLYKATRLAVTDVDAQIGALKAVIGLYKQGNRTGDTLAQANELFKALENMDSGDPRYPTLEKLRLQWAEQNSHAAE